MFGGRSCSRAVGEEAGAEGRDGIDEEDLAEVALLVMERASGELGVVVGWWVVLEGGLQGLLW